METEYACPGEKVRSPALDAFPGGVYIHRINTGHSQNIEDGVALLTSFHERNITL